MCLDGRDSNIQRIPAKSESADKDDALQQFTAPPTQRAFNSAVSVRLRMSQISKRRSIITTTNWGYHQKTENGALALIIP